MAIPDPLEALVAFLTADVDVAALVAGRVYGDEIPQAALALLATGETILQTVVIRDSGAEGSVGDASRVGWSKPRVDVFSYGETPFRAKALDLACYRALKQMVPNTQGSCRLQDATLLTGAVFLREEDTHWPLVFRSYAVAVAEDAVGP